MKSMKAEQEFLVSMYWNDEEEEKEGQEYRLILSCCKHWKILNA